VTLIDERRNDATADAPEQPAPVAPRIAAMQAEPWRFDFFDVMRRLERSHRLKPRIGDSSARREDYVQLGQDPFMEFPASNLSRVEPTNERLKIFVKFLGLLGPQGALPLVNTEESLGWFMMRDDAFPRFLDLINHRFLQLFFRAWADARQVAQHDRPDADRFIAYIGSVIGIGTAPHQNLDSVPDPAKLAFAGLIGPQTKCASRLRGFLGGLFGVRVEIDEFVGSWLEFDPADRSRLGQAHSALGGGMSLGASIFSVQDKFRIRVFSRDMSEYRRFLPTGDLCKPVADAVFFYIGDQLDWEVELAIPAGKVEPVRLGISGQIGWTGWLSPNWAAQEDYRCDARFHPADRVHGTQADQTRT
jgi:type VI secretion system protein ImpH